jgi:hypothetical protein
MMGNEGMKSRWLLHRGNCQAIWWSQHLRRVSVVGFPGDLNALLPCCWAAGLSSSSLIHFFIIKAYSVYKDLYKVVRLDLATRHPSLSIKPPAPGSSCNTKFLDKNVVRPRSLWKSVTSSEQPIFNHRIRKIDSDALCIQTSTLLYRFSLIKK